MTLVVSVPPGRDPERRYAAHVLLGEFLGLDWRLQVEDRRDVRLAFDNEPAKVVYEDGLFAHGDDDWLTAASLPAKPFPLPYLWPNDPFGTAFFFLTRYEELVKPDRDHRDRFPAAAAAVADRPIVNEVLEALWGDLVRAFPRLERKQRSFELVVTHDVDVPSCRGRSVRNIGSAALRSRDVVLTARRIAGADPCDTFGFLLDASERRGLRSAFYFIADEESYALDDVRPLLRTIHERGHEIGLHPSYDTFRDLERTRAELARLRAVCAEEGIEQEHWGGRQHFLRWEAPTTWQIWEDAGLTYDSTVGWSESAGFRSGVCYDYPAFNLATRTMLTLRERPLVVMDTTMLDHLDLGSRALDAMVELKRTCRKYNGSFVLLWHNNRLQRARDRRMYEAALDA